VYVPALAELPTSPSLPSAGPYCWPPIRSKISTYAFTPALPVIRSSIWYPS